MLFVLILTQIPSQIRQSDVAVDPVVPSEAEAIVEPAAIAEDEDDTKSDKPKPPRPQRPAKPPPPTKPPKKPEVKPPPPPPPSPPKKPVIYKKK